MLTKKITIVFLGLVMIITGLVGGAPVQAADTNNDWRFAAELYGWYAGVKGTSRVDSEVDIGANDLIDSLNMGFMGTFGARKGKWLFVADGIYLNADDDIRPMAGMDHNVELTGWIISPFVGYQTLQTKHIDLYLQGGIRYLDLKTDVELNFSDPFPAASGAVSKSGNNWDGIVGVSGHVKLSDNWHLPYYLDVGTGESRLTWQALLAVEYRFERIDLVAGYRYLSWDLDDDSLLEDLSISGPYAGIKFRF